MMRTWRSFYPNIQGCFFDEQATDPDHVRHCVQLRGIAQELLPDALVVCNPGDRWNERYLGTATDLVSIWEKDDLTSSPRFD